MDNVFKLLKQKLLIEYMLADETVFQRCRNILKSSYFDPELTKAVDIMLEHANKYNTLPTISQISAEANIKLELIPDIRDKDQLWAMNNIERFCQQGAVVKAVTDAVQYIESGDHGTIELMIREAVLVGLQKDLGLDYFHNPRERLERLKLKNLIPTGWRDIDRKLYGGLNRGELTIFTAGSGVGKSLFLQNACLNWVSGVSYSWRDDQEAKIVNPMNVMYISLELSQDLTSKRIDSMVTGIGARDIFKRIDEVETMVTIKGKKSGRFTIKYLSQGSNANDIRALIKEYEIVYGFKPDCIAVDYLDEMAPINKTVKVDNLYIKDQHITGDLRDLAVELDIIMITASQLNRCLTLDTIIDINGIKTKIKNSKVGDWIQSDEGPVKIIEKTPISKQPVYKITTKSGKSIIVSSKHIFPTNNGLKNIESGLKIGDTLRSLINTSATQVNTNEYIIKDEKSKKMDFNQ